MRDGERLEVLHVATRGSALDGTADGASAATDGGCSVEGRGGWAAGGAIAERQRGSGPGHGALHGVNP